MLKSSCYWHETKTTLSEALEDWEQRHHGVGWFFYCTRFSTYNATYNDVSALPVFTTSTTSESSEEEAEGAVSAAQSASDSQTKALSKAARAGVVSERRANVESRSGERA